MKVWVGIIIGIFIGFMLGLGISFNMWYQNYRGCMELNDKNFNDLKKCITDLIECNNRSSTNIGRCEEITDDYKKMVNESIESCDDLINDYQGLIESCNERTGDWKEMYFDEIDYCDERVEEYIKFIEGDCKFEEQDFMIIEGIEYDCTYNRYNCANFSTWVDAQTVFEYCIYQGEGDIHWLDGDDDGIACENLYYEEYGESNLNFGLFN